MLLNTLVYQQESRTSRDSTSPRKETEACSFSLSQLSAMLIHIPRMLSLPSLSLTHPRLRKERDLPSYTEKVQLEKAINTSTSERVHSQFIFIAVFQLNALVSLYSAFSFYCERCFSVTSTHIQERSFSQILHTSG